MKHPDHSHQHRPPATTEHDAPVKAGYPQHPEQDDPAAHGHDGHAGHAGHDKHAGHSVEMFRDRFWISLALTIPTVIWGHMLMELTGWHPPTFPGSEWIGPVLGTAVFVYGGRVFLQGAADELK
jgi:P-type Cu2+ transporter